MLNAPYVLFAVILPPEVNIGFLRHARFCHHAKNESAGSAVFFVDGAVQLFCEGIIGCGYAQKLDAQVVVHPLSGIAVLFNFFDIGHEQSGQITRWRGIRQITANEEIDEQAGDLHNIIMVPPSM